MRFRRNHWRAIALLNDVIFELRSYGRRPGSGFGMHRIATNFKMLFKLYVLRATALLSLPAICSSQVLPTDTILPPTDSILPSTTTDAYAVYQDPSFQKYFTVLENGRLNVTTAGADHPVECPLVPRGLTRFYLLDQRE